MNEPEQQTAPDMIALQDKINATHKRLEDILRMPVDEWLKTHSQAHKVYPDEPHNT